MADNTISPVVPNVSGGRNVSTGQKAVTQTAAQSGIDFKSYLGGRTAVQDNSTTFLKRRNSYTLNKNNTKEISIKTASKNSPTESEVKKITDDISSQIVEKVTDDLDISEDELNNAMQLLGLTAMDLLNPANLSALYCEVTGNASDPQALVLYPRMIRDLSRTLNKKMNLVITGEDTELDRTVVDQIGDPLQHLLRNSADHGLESNEVRLERGKPEVGTIFLNAYQEGNNVVIKVGDDGNGIDTEAVKNKAIERGIVTAEQAENLSQKDIINFLFMPSFSMAKQITDISGRGVGLDVVKSGIEQLGGDVSVSTELGKGTTFTVRLPLTLAIIQALMVEIRDEIYAIALGSISNIEDIPVKDIKYVQAKEVIHLRGSVIPIIRLDKMLDIEPKEQEPDHLTVVIVQKGDQQAGLVVDNLIGQQEIVIKSLGKYINGNKLISGATILGDGDVALILDVNTLM